MVQILFEFIFQGSRFIVPAGFMYMKAAGHSSSSARKQRHYYRSAINHCIATIRFAVITAASIPLLPTTLLRPLQLIFTTS